METNDHSKLFIPELFTIYLYYEAKKPKFTIYLYYEAKKPKKKHSRFTILIKNSSTSTILSFEKHSLLNLKDFIRKRHEPLCEPKNICCVLSQILIRTRNLYMFIEKIFIF